MDAVEFLKEANRMHNFDNQDCAKCEINKRRGGNLSCVNWTLSHPAEAVEIVERWAKEHPQKTRQSEFLKMFPKALLFDGVPDIDPCKIIHSKINSKECHAFDELGDVGCFECRKQFWNEEVE